MGWPYQPSKTQRLTGQCHQLSQQQRPTGWPPQMSSCQWLTRKGSFMSGVNQYQWGHIHWIPSAMSLWWGCHCLPSQHQESVFGPLHITLGPCWPEGAHQTRDTLLSDPWPPKAGVDVSSLKGGRGCCHGWVMHLSWSRHTSHDYLHLDSYFGLMSSSI